MKQWSYEELTQASQEMLQSVSSVKTLDGGAPIYSCAEISLITFHWSEIRPTALYVLDGNLQRIKIIADDCELQYGIDIFALNQIHDGGDYVVSPPIIEQEGDSFSIIDGLHRCYMARELNREITAILVKNFDSRFPFIYSPVEWNEAVRYHSRPTDARLLRRMRAGFVADDPILLKYYRDLRIMGSLGKRPPSYENFA